jgi:glyoxylase I family protein
VSNSELEQQALKGRSLITRIDHCSLIVANTDKALEFYSGILGLQRDQSRPDLGYPGAWLWVATEQIHLLEVPNPDSMDNRPEHGGRDHHLALQVSDLSKVIQRLEVADIAYSKSKSGRAALFCRDFDGNAIELLEK